MKHIVATVKSVLHRINQVGNRRNHHTELHRPGPLPVEATTAQYLPSTAFFAGSAGASGYYG
ncbi:hypothetical protein ACIA8O_26925 [Kitasatospora sp. NPDC051853]|uniref:hypothetical protein n=1 Tax=Kitasatospora sp. NPDC051853 TaxID=3364058 RepID=UPI00379B213C